LCRNGLLKDIIEGNIEGSVELKARRGRKHKQLLDNCKKNGLLEIERGSAKSLSVEYLLCKSLLTFRKADYGIYLFI
jgi:hypothetical protein